MIKTAPNLITIPANPELAKSRAVQRQLRVAAYCRVSTDDEEQLTSYEAQQNYYTDKIMTNPNWTMAGIFADEGITGTAATKRPEFLKMIRRCRQKKIDVVLVKSISRFARNTVDCLNYIRALRELGIAVIFEKENINTLESDSEMLITMMGAFAQAESESISTNVRWGKRQAMREGKAVLQYKHLYAYERGEDGKPRIIPEQAEVVRRIYDSFLVGHSVRMIKNALKTGQITTSKGGAVWSESVIRSILKNEKYCKDSPTIYEKPLQRAILAAINSAMSQREVLIEKIANAMRFELAPSSGETMSVAAIDQRLSELEGKFKALFGQYRESGDYAKYADAFKQINDSMAELKEKRALLLEQQKSDSAASRQVNDAISILNTASPEITEWDESMIRQLVDTVKVLSAERIRAYLRGGMEIEQELDKERD